VGPRSRRRSAYSGRERAPHPIATRAERADATCYQPGRSAVSGAADHERTAPASTVAGRRPAESSGTATATGHTPLLALRDVHVVRGGQVILDVPALDVWPDDLLAVLGPNGAGKSTLLQVMALLLAPDQGQVRFHGRAVDARRNPVPIRRCMAV